MNIHNALAAGQAFGALQNAGAFSHPLLKLALRYWWLSVPAGLALYGRIQERRAKGETKIHHYFGATAEIVGPIMTVVAMAELAGKMQREGKLEPKSPPPPPQPSGMQGVSRLHGDVIHPPEYTEETPP